MIDRRTPYHLFCFFSLFLILFPSLLSADSTIMITAEKTFVFAEPTHNATPLYVLKKDHVFNYLSSVDAFFEIALIQGRTGWVLQKDSQLISQNKSTQLSILTPVSIAPKHSLFGHTGQESMLFPRKRSHESFDINTTGFIEIKASGRDYTPKHQDSGLWQTIINDPIYKKIPQDVLIGDIDIDYRLKLAVEGRVSNHLFVNYDIEQEHEMPSKYDVDIRYKKHHMQFFNLDTDYTQGNFINIKKSLRGFQYKYNGDPNFFQLSSGKERSISRVLQGFGTGKAVISLAHKFIFSDSVRVYLNNSEKKEGKDYTIDYILGVVTFSRPIQSTDYYKIIYEYSNPIADFLPSLSRKSFEGFQYKRRSSTTPVYVKKTATISETWGYLSHLNLPESPYSAYQVLPDSFSLIDGISLPLSRQLFDALVEQKILSRHGYIHSNIENNPLIFEASSPFVSFNDDISRWLLLLYSEAPPASPIFILKKNPIVLGSQDLLLNGTKLLPNTDYSLDFTQGILRIFCPITPKDTLAISYAYYNTENVYEDLLGKDTIGPYQLRSFPIVDGSLDVKVSGTPLTESIDYIINTETGQLHFNAAVEYPTIISLSYKSIQKEKSIKTTKKERLEIDATYLSVYIPVDEENRINSVSNEAVTVVNNRFFVANTPIVDTDTIEVFINSEKITTADYTVVSLYKGEILLHSSPTNTDRITASYRYHKSFQTRTQIRGNGSEYFNLGGSEDLFRNIPIRYKGVDRLVYYRSHDQTEIALELGVDFNVSYFDEGNYISIEYLINQDGGKLVSYPSQTDLITIYYQFTDISPTHTSDAKHSMFGTVLKADITQKWSISADIAVAENNFSSQINEEPLKQLTSTGADNVFYYLGHTNIVENSEQVFIDGEPQSRDADYTIIYKTGKIRFKDSPQSSTKIEVLYAYYKKNSALSTGKKQTALATKLSSHYIGDSVEFKSSYSFIDKKFKPIGSLNNKAGNRIFSSSLKWHLSPSVVWDSSYTRKKTLAGETNEGRSLYQHTDIFNTSFSHPLFSLFDANHDFMYQFDLKNAANKSQGGPAYDIDTLLYRYNGSYHFGPSFFRSQTNYSFSNQLFDVRDNVNPTRKNTTSFGYDSTLTLSNLLLLGDITMKPHYSRAYNAQLYASQSPSSYSLNETYQLNGSITPYSFLKITPSFSFKQKKNKQVSSPSVISLQTLNYATHGTLTPYSWFNMTASFSNKEDMTSVIGNKSNLHYQQSIHVQKLLPYTGIRKLGFSDKHYLANMMRKSNLTFYYSNSKKKQKNRQVDSNNTTHRIGLTTLTLLSPLTLNNLTLSSTAANQDNTISSSTASSNMSQSLTKGSSGSLVLAPKWSFLKYVTLKSNLNEERGSTKTSFFARTVTGSISEESNHQSTLSSEMLIKSPVIYIPFLKHKKRLRIGSFSLHWKYTDLHKNITTEKYNLIYHANQDQFHKEKKISHLIELKRSNTHVIHNTITPFNRITIKSSHTLHDTYLNRNRSISDRSTLQQGADHTLSTSFSPFYFLSFSISGTFSSSDQWTIASINIPIRTLKESPLSDTLKNTSRAASLSSTLSPYRFLSLKTAYTLKDIIEKNKTQHNRTDSRFKNHETSGTLTLTPIRSLEFIATYSHRTVNQQKGVKQTQRIVYTPIKRTHSTIEIEYTRTQSTGNGLNTLNQELTQQGTGDLSSTEIVKQQNVVHSGSLLVSLIYPIENPFIKNMTLDAEGYIKSIQDSIKPSNSYSLSGVVVKGVLNF